MKKFAFGMMFLNALWFISCDVPWRRIVVFEETLEFTDDSSFQVEYFVSRLPIVQINTGGKQIPDEPRILAHIGVIDNGEDRFNRNTDRFSGHQGMINIERRGFTSQNFPKKQYAFETQYANGSEENVELLGFPTENDWVLHAPYSDKTLIRNVLIYKWWNDLGHYASRTRYCELLLNGQYQGLYILMEQIKWDRNRVDIAVMDWDDNQGDSLTGGYIIKVDKPVGGDGEFDWHTSVESFEGTKANVSFQYDYPKDDRITMEQKQYIQAFVSEFEHVLLSDSFADAGSGYRKYLDVGSFIDFFILQELAHNVDGYRSSTYLYKTRNSDGGKLHAGPIWDFNLALGNTDGCDGEKAEGWALDHPCDPTVIPFWWRRMVQDPLYKKQLAQRWKELRAGPLSDAQMLADIDRQVAEMGAAVQRNYTRWPVLGKKVWPNYFVGKSYSEEVQFLKTWLLERADWIDRNIDRP